MKQVIVRAFGGVENLRVEEVPTPEPGPGEVRVRLTSIGMNYADLMGRRGEYKLSTGEPPYVPGLEGGGVIEAVGEGVDASRIGERVTLSPAAPRRSAHNLGGTYRSHYVTPAHHALAAPPGVPDEQLGALWLTYLTAWGCLVGRENVEPGRVVGIPAASSAVGLAASQVAKKAGATTIGFTSSPGKVEQLRAMPQAKFDHLIVTHEPDRSLRPWHRDVRQAIGNRGVDVFFDPVAAGPYLDTEIKCLAQNGTIWIYGLLGDPGVVDVTPLIRKHGSIRGWSLSNFVAEGDDGWRAGCAAILESFADGEYGQRVEKTFRLDEVRHAHEEMERGRHIGKLVLVP